MDVGGAEKSDEKPVEAGAVEELEKVRSEKPKPCAPGKSSNKNETSLEEVWIFNMELAADSLAAIGNAVTEEGLLLARRGEEASGESADEVDDELKGHESDSDWSAKENDAASESEDDSDFEEFMKWAEKEI